MIKNYDFKELSVMRNNFSNYVIINNKVIVEKYRGKGLEKKLMSEVKKLLK